MMENLLFSALIALFTLTPALWGGEAPQTMILASQPEEETVYLTKEALEILRGEAPWLEAAPQMDRDGIEEGILDMRYVIVETPKGEAVAGIRLKYPCAMDIDAVSLSAYEVVGYPHVGLYLNNDGVWGHAEQAGCYVFLMLDKLYPVADIWPPDHDGETAPHACDLHIDIWQTERITMQNGSYVLPHMFIATEGLYPDEAPTTRACAVHRHRRHADGRRRHRRADRIPGIFEGAP